MEMNGTEAPAKVTVYVKLCTTSVPERILGVQFGFGHTCGAENGLTVSDGIVSLPFLGESVPLLVEADNVVV